MYDVFHEWGADLIVGSGGDLKLVANSDAVSQRVCRRLLTNPGDYLWSLDYGGGLGQFVGRPANPSDIEAVIMDQLLLEAAIPQTPVPEVTTSVIDRANGNVIANITYADPTSQRLVTLSVIPG